MTSAEAELILETWWKNFRRVLANPQAVILGGKAYVDGQVSDHSKGVISSVVSLFESIPFNSRSSVFFSTKEIILLATNSLWESQWFENIVPFAISA